MIKYVALLFILSLCHAKEMVKVSVYYESLCPDSIKFFTKQLYPTLQGNLSQYIELTLIPYGKSTQSFNSVLNQWEFQCHHGPNECYGNKVHACALAKISYAQNTPNMGYNKVTVAFINCLLDQVKREPFMLPIRDCASLNKVPNVVEIENCVNHTDGTNLLVNLGHITEKLSPPLTSVPTIVFNGVYNKMDNDLAQTDFSRALCGHIMGDMPHVCHTNTGIVAKSSLLTIFTIVFIMLFRNM